MWADLGQPVLFFILFSWLVLGIVSIASSMMRKGAAFEWKQILQRWIDPHPHHDRKRKL